MTKTLMTLKLQNSEIVVLKEGNGKFAVVYDMQVKVFDYTGKSREDTLDEALKEFQACCAHFWGSYQFY